MVFYNDVKWFIAAKAVSCIVDTTCPAYPVELTGSYGQLGTPGSVLEHGKYPNDLNCRWRIRVPTGKVITLTVRGGSEF